MNTSTLTFEKELFLPEIAGNLESQEEDIISNLLARIQHPLNAEVYAGGRSGFDNWQGSLMEKRLSDLEYLDSKWGRFECPEERPFTNNLQPVKRNFERQKTGIMISDFDIVNSTSEVSQAYMDFVVVACERGDDGNYGSTVEHDVRSVRTISKRVHYGVFFVAEAKFQQDPESFLKLIELKDGEGIEALLTREDVENQIFERVARKTDELQRSANVKYRRKIDPELVKSFYKTHIIPITKQGEINYLLNRTL